MKIKKIILLALTLMAGTSQAGTGASLLARAKALSSKKQLMAAVVTVGAIAVAICAYRYFFGGPKPDDGKDGNGGYQKASVVVANPNRVCSDLEIRSLELASVAEKTPPANKGDSRSGNYYK